MLAAWKTGVSRRQGCSPPEAVVSRTRVLLADDHTLITAALRKLLEGEFEVVGSVEDGRALLNAAIDLRADVVVLDIGLPLLNGLDAGQQLRERHPEIKIVYLTQNRDPNLAAEAFRRKASGYLLKNSAASELSLAIREAVRGRSYVSPLIAKGMMECMLNRGPGGEGLPGLTPRQREVLQLLAEGKSMKEVAAILNITTRTVEFHKYRVMELLSLKTNAELVQYAVRQGIVST
jgi:DNA-binding NarL/FixJ family response regulator